MLEVNVSQYALKEDNLIQAQQHLTIMQVTTINAGRTPQLTLFLQDALRTLLQQKVTVFVMLHPGMLKTG